MRTQDTHTSLLATFATTILIATLVATANYMTLSGHLLVAMCLSSGLVIAASSIATTIPSILLIIINFSFLFLETTPFFEFTIIRTCTFAIVVMLASYLKPKIPAIYWISILWTLTLVSTPYWDVYHDNSAHSTYEIKEHSLIITYSIFIECLLTLLISVIFNTPKLSSKFGFRIITQSSKQYCIQIFALAIVGAAFISFLSIMQMMHLSQENLPQTASLSIGNTIIPIVALALVLVMPALTISRTITNFAQYTIYMLTKRPFPTSCEHPLWIFSEFNDIIHKLNPTLSEVDSELRFLRSQVQDINRMAESKERVIAKREQYAANSARIIDAAPLGAIIIKANRTIIQVNETFRRYMDLGDKELSMKDIAALDSKHPWSAQIISILASCCSSPEQFLEQSHVKFYSSSVKNQILEITVQAFYVPDNPLENMEGREHIPLSDIMIILYCTKTRDMRDFQLGLIAPSKQDLVEKHAISLCDMTFNQLSGILDDVGELIKISRTITNPDTSHNLRLLLQDIKKLAEDSSIHLNAATQSLTAEQDVQDVNLSVMLQNALYYLSNLMCMTDPIQLSGNPDITDETRHIPSFTQQQDSGPIEVKLHINKKDLNVFVATFLALVHGILPKTQSIHISLTTEHIGSGTASILATNTTGQFARIDIQHPGQSITPNMTLRSLAEISVTNRSLSQIEIAIVLLTYHARRLGGFITVQSSQRKGTAITTYIPVIQPRTVAIPPSDIAGGTLNQTRKRQSTNKTNNILLISLDTNEVPTLSRMLSHLGFVVTFESANHYASVVDDSVFDFHGAGFNNETIASLERNELEPMHPSSPEEDAIYDIIVINIAKNATLVPELFSSINRRYPSTAKILLHEEPGFLPKIDNSTILKKPFDLESLATIVQQIVHNKLVSAQQSPIK